MHDTRHDDGKHDISTAVDAGGSRLTFRSDGLPASLAPGRLSLALEAPGNVMEGRHVVWRVLGPASGAIRGALALEEG